MKIIFSPRQLAHRPEKEMSDGRLVDAVETPARAEAVLAGLQAAGFDAPLAPQAFGRDPLERVHAVDYLDFLETIWADWRAAGRAREAFPFVWPVRGMRTDRAPRHIDGRLGRYSFDAGTPLTAGTYEAARASTDAALTAAAHLRDGAATAFALCRPPGHHAGPDFFGGYCFLNNGAIAAQWLLDQGAARVALLDIDYHHGNGSQAIFEARRDVFFLSLHADPAEEYPYFTGYADETGVGEGDGFTANFPLPLGTDGAHWNVALAAANAHIAAYGPDAIVVSLGLDTFEGDPLGAFRLTSNDFVSAGAALARLNVPTLFVFEGGYAVDALGDNAAAFFEGFHNT